MRALTLWQPWAWLIVHGHKLVENRPWAPAPSLLSPGERFAIHAGKRFEVGDWESLLDVAEERGIQIPKKADIELGAIVGTARFVRTVTSAEAIEDPKQRVWFGGPIGWLLDEPEAYANPIVMNGALGLWEVPDSSSASENDHHCHLPGCETPTPRKFLYCPTHWRMVPQELQGRVWKAYYAAGGTGDGPIKRATQEYVDATKAAEEAVLAKLAKRKPKQGSLFTS